MNNHLNVLYESVDQCPVCGSKKSKKLYDGLSDNICKKSINDKYEFYQCSICKSGYYNPRVTRDTVGYLYEGYHTHAKIEYRKPYSSLSKLKKIQRRIANSYTNKIYGTKDSEVFPFANHLMSLFPKYKKSIDLCFRFIPNEGKKKYLLDFGCGNGGYLMFAERCGYIPYGVDFDKGSVQQAKKYIRNVFCGDIDIIKKQDIKYDVITLSHVMEHLYNPVKYLQEFYDLLIPGGFIYIETPNIKSFGHEIYKQYWRGLEPPRHIQIFSTKSLVQCLKNIGFISIKIPTKYNPIKYITEQANIIIGYKANSAYMNIIAKTLNVMLPIITNYFIERNEYVYLIAYKPKD